MTSRLIAAGLFACLVFLPPAVRGETDAPVFPPKDARVLFQGDSITDGNRGRNADPNHILGHGYQFIVAARLGAAYPERNVTFINRGVSGNKVTDLAARWKKDTIELKPTVVSILIGVNDAGAAIGGRKDATTVEKFEEVYGQLIEETQAALPGVRVVLCEPFVLPVGNVKAKWDEWSAEVARRRAVVEKLAAKHKLPLVRFQKTFDEATKRAPADYWIWDGVHPTYAGHQLMADEWGKTVEAAWRDAAR
jgi:lysophospholipase L1-like esterase